MHEEQIEINQRAFHDNPQKLLIGVPMGLDIMSPATDRWLCKWMSRIQSHPAVSEVQRFDPRSSRILMNRNMIAKRALEWGARWLLMIDPDMDPDVYVGKVPHAQPFFDSAMQFVAGYAEKGIPSIVGAPALCAPPGMPVNVFWSGPRGDRVRQMTHDEASQRRGGGFERVAAIGTGVILIDCEVFNRIDPPWFDDIYTDEFKAEVHTSQDVYFCYKANNAGCQVVANWNAPSGHSKLVMLGMPGWPALEKEISYEHFPAPDEQRKRVNGQADQLCTGIYSEQPDGDSPLFTGRPGDSGGLLGRDDDGSGCEQCDCHLPAIGQWGNLGADTRNNGNVSVDTAGSLRR